MAVLLATAAGVPGASAGLALIPLVARWLARPAKAPAAAPADHAAADD